MKEQIDLVRGWMAKADSDLLVVRRMLEGSGPYDTACFHAQQAIEKMLKGFLLFHGLPIPRTHDLEELQHSCLAIQSLPELARLDLVQTSDYAVMARYDFDFWPDRATAVEALSLAEQVRRIILRALPIDAPFTNR